MPGVALFFLLRVIMFSTERETLVILYDKYPILPVIVLAMFLFLQTAEKYYGAIDWMADEAIFILSIMMTNEDRG